VLVKTVQRTLFTQALLRIPVETIKETDTGMCFVLFLADFIALVEQYIRSTRFFYANIDVCVFFFLYI